MLSKLRTFVTIADMHSFSQAARALNISQPAASKQIAALERYYGTPLFERDGQETTLTRCGNILYAHAVNILAAAADMDNAVASLAHTQSGTLNIGASTIPGHYILPRLLGKFINAYPAIIPSVTTGDTARITDQLSSGRLDLAIIGAPTTSTSYVCRPLFSDQIVLIVPVDHPFASRKKIAPDELSGQPYIDRERGSATRKVVTTALGSAARFISPMLELDSTEAVVNAVRSGAGISFVSRWAVPDYAHDNLHILTMDNIDLCRYIYCCHLQAAENLSLINSFYDFAQTNAPQLPGARHD